MYVYDGSVIIFENFSYVLSANFPIRTQPKNSSCKISLSGSVKPRAANRTGSSSSVKPSFGNTFSINPRLAFPGFDLSK